MRITESQLRKVIREVIEETMSVADITADQKEKVSKADLDRQMDGQPHDHTSSRSRKLTKHELEKLQQQADEEAAKRDQEYFG